MYDTLHQKFKDYHSPVNKTRLTAAGIADVLGPIETPVHQGTFVKALSTIGIKPVLELLTSNKELIRNWSDEDKRLLLEHAAEKELAMISAIDNFPSLFSGYDSVSLKLWQRKANNMLDSIAVSLRLSDKQLKETLWIRQGGLPLLLTVPDDGIINSIDGLDLPYDPRSKARDTAVNVVAQDIYEQFTESGAKHPSIISQRIGRKHLTPQIIAYFESQIFQALCSMGMYHQGPVFHIDLHGFTRQPSFGSYDLILGTGHRKTVKTSDIDIQFFNFMEKRGYSLYLPTGKSRHGEIFTASNPSTLVQRVSHLDIPHVAASMQLEIGSEFRKQENTSKGKRLSRDMAEFIQAYLPPSGS